MAGAVSTRQSGHVTGTQTVHDLDDLLVQHLVEHVYALAATPEDSLVAHEAEVLRRRGLLEIQGFLDRAHVELPAIVE